MPWSRNERVSTGAKMASTKRPPDTEQQSIRRAVQVDAEILGQPACREGVLAAALDQCRQRRGLVG